MREDATQALVLAIDEGPRRAANAADEGGAANPPAATATGWLLFVVGLLMAGSAFLSLRIELGGLLIHPYLPVATLLGLWVIPARVQAMPLSLLGPIVLFCTMYWVASAPYSGGAGEVVKLVSAWATVVVVALSVRNSRDFELGALGLVAASLVLSARGLAGLESSGPLGINPFDEVANKNAFSLYALPALLLAASRVVTPSVSTVLRVFYGVSAAATTLALFATANRSGWAAAALIALMVLVGAGVRWRSVLLVAALAASVGGLLSWSQSASMVVENRIERTTGGYESDDIRTALFVQSLAIGLENPIAGVSPQRLPRELGSRLRLRGLAKIDPHNTIALVVGGCGLIAFGALIWSLGALWMAVPRVARTPGELSPGLLLRMMVTVWIFRGLFTREILYSPAFAMGLGLCLGLCLCTRSIQRTSENECPSTSPSFASS